MIDNVIHKFGKNSPISIHFCFIAETEHNPKILRKNYCQAMNGNLNFIHDNQEYLTFNEVRWG